MRVVTFDERSNGRSERNRLRSISFTSQEGRRGFSRVATGLHSSVSESLPIPPTARVECKGCLWKSSRHKKIKTQNFIKFICHLVCRVPTGQYVCYMPLECRPLPFYRAYVCDTHPKKMDLHHHPGKIESTPTGLEGSSEKKFQSSCLLGFGATSSWIWRFSIV